MIRADCDWIRDDLDAFADGELRGAELRLVSQHVESCRRCAEEVESRQTLGGLIRESVADSYHTPIPTGLAAGVVARVRAESYFSWRSGLTRAVEDWHWVIVGGGAVTATFLAMLFCSALLVFGTAQPDGDSLSALGANLRSSPGSLYAEVSRQGGDQKLILVQLDTGEGSALPAFLLEPLAPSRVIPVQTDGQGYVETPYSLSSASPGESFRARYLFRNPPACPGQSSWSQSNSLRVTVQ